MPFTLIKGRFKPGAGIPDGGSVRFLADDLKLWDRLEGKPVELGKGAATKDTAQLRFAVSVNGAWRDGYRSVWRDGQPWFSSRGWADGGGPIDFDPKRQRFYEVTAGGLGVFDAETMALMLLLPQPVAGDFERYDAETDQLLFRVDGQVKAWPASAIQPPAPEPLTDKPLPKAPVLFLAVSPNWAEDQTLFGIWNDPAQDYECWQGNNPGTREGLFFLSRDGGQTWGQSLGGLHGSCELITILAVSPDYARGQTLLAGVLGFGIFKSTDGGRLWQPSSAGLTYMLA